jgi:hypothetical protein
MIFGTIEKQGEVTRIHVQMRIMPLATLFIAFLLGVILIMGIYLLFLMSKLACVSRTAMMLAFGYFIELGL